MMKKICLIITIFNFLLVTNVYAKDIYYTNKNGVSLSKEEYDFLNFMFFENCQDLMTNDDYIKFINSNIMNGEIKSATYSEPIPFATTVDTASKTLNIVASCNSDCLISVRLSWKGIPNIKSYDVMGAYLDNTSLLNTPSTTMRTTNESVTSREIQTFNNGFGVSIKLPQSGSSYIANQVFKVSKSGTVYASYQHATRNISLADSKRYTMSKTGYGGVFNFSGNAASVYDNMNGVSISL